MTEKTDWHKILQEMFEDIENLQELSSKIIVGKAREYQQMIRADFICHTKKAFCRYVGRTMDAETRDKLKLRSIF